MAADRPLVIAHRGFSGRCPENTAPAFMAAIDAGADMIELDARRTAGADMAVIHDGDLARYGHPGKRTADLEIGALKSLDAGAWFGPAFAGARFLTLAEALIAIGGRVPVNVEVKVDTGEESHIETIVESTLAEVAAANSPPVLFSTFSLPAFRLLRARAPAIPAAFLHGRGDLSPLLSELEAIGAEGVHLARPLASPAIVEETHRHGLKLRVYTVNDPAEMAELLALSVDGLFTDWPDRLLGLLGRAGATPGWGGATPGPGGGPRRGGGITPER
jgi:glycerophosphoryl diester phosphodiesterase